MNSMIRNYSASYLIGDENYHHNSDKFVFMILALDFGNTRAKGACFENEAFVQSVSFDTAEELAHFVSEKKISEVVYATVRETANWLEGLTLPLNQLTNTTEIPITNAYETPKTLGMDRLAAVIGAEATYPKSNCLVIDMGTCITFDFIDSNNVYHGGAISPGVEMRLKALHNFTGALPLVDKTDSWTSMGNDTISCIQVGVMQGILDEVNGRIHEYRSLYKDVRVLFTGGDAPLFESKIKAPIFVHPNLVLEGLNRIFLHGEANK